MTATTKRLASAPTPTSIKKHLFFRSSVALLLGTLPIVSLSLPNRSLAQSVKYCQCTEYAANRFGLTRDFPNAKDWNDGYLQKNGFRQIGLKKGAIVVMEKSFPGADTTYGHVGVVENIRYVGVNTYIDVRGANQYVGSSYVTESGCNNVRVTSFAAAVNGRSDVSFWEKGITGTTKYPITVNFSGIAASSGVNIRSAPSLSASIIGRLQPNQSVSFNGWTYGDVVTDIWLGTPDARWFRLSNKVNGQDGWVSSAVIYGNPPNSTPMP